MGKWASKHTFCALKFANSICGWSSILIHLQNQATSIEWTDLVELCVRCVCFLPAVRRVNGVIAQLNNINTEKSRTTASRTVDSDSVPHNILYLAFTRHPLTFVVCEGEGQYSNYKSNIRNCNSSLRVAHFPLYGACHVCWSTREITCSKQQHLEVFAVAAAAVHLLLCMLNLVCWQLNAVVECSAW